MKEKEQWRSVEGYEELYEVSNYGQVWSIRSQKMLSQYKNKGGYCLVSLSKDGIQKNKRVNRLVAIAFIPNPENKPIAHHIDAERSNNLLSNLAWATSKENLNADDVQKKRVASMDYKAAAIKRYKPVDQYNLDGMYVASWDSLKQIEEILCYNKGFISTVCNGIKDKAYGYVWKFAEVSA